MKYFKSYFLIVALCVSILILPYSSFGFQNEPDSFRGIKWGTHINTLSDTDSVDREDEPFAIYKKKNDTMKIRDAEIEEITYHFYKGRLFGVGISFMGFTNFDHLKSTFFQLYGKAHRLNRIMEEYYWFGAKLTIMFKYSDTNKKGEILYSYKPIREELIKDKKEAADL